MAIFDSPGVIAVKEMQAVCCALTTFCGLLPHLELLKIHTNNTNVLYILLRSTSQASSLRSGYFQLFHLLRQSEILLRPFSIPSTLNKVSDTLLVLSAPSNSLLQFDTEFCLNPCVFWLLQCTWQQGLLQWVDKFAAPDNTQLPVFWSPTQVPYPRMLTASPPHGPR